MRVALRSRVNSTVFVPYPFPTRQCPKIAPYEHLDDRCELTSMMTIDIMIRTSAPREYARSPILSACRKLGAFLSRSGTHRRLNGKRSLEWGRIFPSARHDFLGSRRFRRFFLKRSRRQKEIDRLRARCINRPHASGIRDVGVAGSNPVTPTS